MTTKKPSTPKKAADASKKKAPAASKAKKAKAEEVEEKPAMSMKPLVSKPKKKEEIPAPAPVVAPKPVVAAAPAAPKIETPAAAPKTETPAPAIKKPAAPAAPAKPPMQQYKPAAPKRPYSPPAPIRPAAPAKPQQSQRRPPPKIEAPKEEVSASGRKKILFNEMMTAKDLAAAMQVSVGDLIKKLLSLGTPASINQRINLDAATLVAEAFEFDLELKSIYVDEVKEEEEKPESLTSRPPVVTVMGHVDHGKTSLLDAIRSADVAGGEAGGITQHIGAYQVHTNRGVITFLDTPGHEAFTAMRARGANATDIVILVVAADDSVMPQTIEAIDHARAADVPIVVAINKVDLPQANVQRVKQELADRNLLPEDWGGKTVMVEVSAKARTNIDKLLEMILLESELLELKANAKRPAKGVVLEARVDPKRGVTATVLVQSGTLKIGDTIVCGLSYGRVRAMLNDHRVQLEACGPATPAEILGLQHVPQVGDQFAVVNNDREAREIAERRSLTVKSHAQEKTTHLSLESLHSQIAIGKIQDLPIIVKADVQGSMQAIQDSLGRVQSDSIKLRFVHLAVGNVNESDVLLAEAANAIIFAFGVKTESAAEIEAKNAGVDIRSYKIIYEMLADVRAAMEGLLKPVEKEIVKGRANVKQVFPSTKQGAVAGCMITEGKVTRGWKARVIRNGEEVGAGPIVTLRRFKDDVKEVEKGYECGIVVEGVKALAVGDTIEFFVIEKQAQRLEA